MKTPILFLTLALVAVSGFGCNDDESKNPAKQDEKKDHLVDPVVAPSTTPSATPKGKKEASFVDPSISVKNGKGIWTLYGYKCPHKGIKKVIQHADPVGAFANTRDEASLIVRYFRGYTGYEVKAESGIKDENGIISILHPSKFECATSKDGGATYTASLCEKMDLDLANTLTAKDLELSDASSTTIKLTGFFPNGKEIFGCDEKNAQLPITLYFSSH